MARKVGKLTCKQIAFDLDIVVTEKYYPSQSNLNVSPSNRKHMESDRFFDMELSTKVRHQCMYLIYKGFLKYAQRDAYDNHTMNECSYASISVTQIKKSIMKEMLPTPFCAY